MATTEPALILARRLLDAYCAGRLGELAGMLDERLKFDGPLFQGRRARDWLAALAADPPRDMHWQELHSVAAGDRVSIFYRLHAPGRTSVVAQYFETRDGRISRIRVVFGS